MQTEHIFTDRVMTERPDHSPSVAFHNVKKDTSISDTVRNMKEVCAKKGIDPYSAEGEIF